MRMEVVENPRRKKRTTHRRKSPIRRRRVYRRRRNPSLSVVGNPRRRRYARRKNPFRIGGFSITDAAMTGAGVLVGAKLPAILRKFNLPLPSGAIFDSVIAAAFGIFGAKYLKALVGTRAANQIANGAVAYAAYNLLDIYVAPAIGLSGLSLYRPVRPIGLNKYTRSQKALGAGRVIKGMPSARIMRTMPVSY
jgi:hypothetical protein